MNDNDSFWTVNHICGFGQIYRRVQIHDLEYNFQ